MDLRFATSGGLPAQLRGTVNIFEPVEQRRINVDRFEASKANVRANAEYFQSQLGMIMRALGH